jgi:hypothetical protein
VTGIVGWGCVGHRLDVRVGFFGAGSGSGKLPICDWHGKMAVLVVVSMVDTKARAEVGAENEITS